jgi:hypothetical protein
MKEKGKQEGEINERKKKITEILAKVEPLNCARFFLL